MNTGELRAHTSLRISCVSSSHLHINEVGVSVCTLTPRGDGFAGVTLLDTGIARRLLDLLPASRRFLKGSKERLYSDTRSSLPAFLQARQCSVHLLLPGTVQSLQSCQRISMQ